MHDTFLFQRISEKLNEICRENNISRVRKLDVTVNLDSHVNTINLFQYLSSYNSCLIGDWCEIDVKKHAIEKQTAIIETIEGEKGEG